MSVVHLYKDFNLEKAQEVLNDLTNMLSPALLLKKYPKLDAMVLFSKNVKQLVLATEIESVWSHEDEEKIEASPYQYVGKITLQEMIDNKIIVEKEGKLLYQAENVPAFLAEKQKKYDSLEV